MAKICFVYGKLKTKKKKKHEKIKFILTFKKEYTIFSIHTPTLKLPGFS